MLVSLIVSYANTKHAHEYTTSAGKFMYVYTKQKGIVPMSTICGQFKYTLSRMILG